MKTFKKEVIITRLVTVTLDETKFDEEFVTQFNGAMYDYGDLGDVDDMLNQHAEHLAQYVARNDEWCHDSTFIEGYGTLGEMNIKISMTETDVEIEDKIA